MNKIVQIWAEVGEIHRTMHNILYICACAENDYTITKTMHKNTVRTNAHANRLYC